MIGYIAWNLDFPRFSRSWRKRLGVTRQQGADLLDIPLKTLEGWELGREPEHKRVLVLAMRHLEELHNHAGPVNSKA